MTNLKKLKQMLKTITPWPWDLNTKAASGAWFRITGDITENGEEVWDTVCESQMMFKGNKENIKRVISNSKFIAASPQIISALIEIIEVQREGLRKAHGALGYAYDDHADKFYSNSQDSINEAIKKADAILRELEV